MPNVENRISVFPHEGRPQIYFTRYAAGKIMSQYGLRPPRYSEKEKQYDVGDETIRLSLVVEQARGQRHGRELLAFVHELLQAFSNHTGKNVRIRHPVTNAKMVEWLKERGFKESKKEKQPETTIMRRTLKPTNKPVEGPMRDWVEAVLKAAN